MDPEDQDTRVVKLTYTDGESVGQVEATGSSLVEGITGALGEAMLKSTRGVFEQATLNEEYQKLQDEIEACSVFRLRKKRRLETKATELWVELMRQAIIESIGNFETVAVTQEIPELPKE